MEDTKKTIVVSAPVETRSGYGAHARDIVTSLINSGKYNVRIVSTPWGATPLNALSEDNPQHVRIMQCILKPGMQIPKPDIAITISIPNEFAGPTGTAHLGAKLNIGITAGIETTICRPEWILGLNKMHVNIVPSKHAKDVFESMKFEEGVNKLSCETPIDVIFEGLDTSVYKKTSDIKKSVTDKLSGIEQDFCFLFVGHWLQGNLGEDRKDIGMLVQTFCETFKGKSPRTAPALILKTSGASFSNIAREQIINKLRAITTKYEGKHPPIYLLHGDLSDDEMNSLYNHPKVKAMVSFTKGEGYGRPLLEFAATGKPVIASAWSGHMDFLPSVMAVHLPGKLKQVDRSAVNEWIIPQAEWFTVDYPTASAVLLDVFKNYKKHIARSKPLREYVNRFSLENMENVLVDCIEGHWQRIVEQPQNQLRNILLNNPLMGKKK